MSPELSDRHHRPLRRWWRRYEWPVLWSLALLALGFGAFGFASHPDFARGDWGPSDFLYLSLQLFVLESGRVTPPAGLPLEIARILAPGVAVYTASKALLVLFREQITWIRARRCRHHAIIVGLGRTGRLLARQFSHQRRVVAVDRDPANPWMRHPPGGRILVVSGQTVASGVLDRLRPERARYLIAVTGDDATNVGIALRARDRVRRSSRRRPLDCYVHLADPRIANLLLEREIGRPGSESFRIEFFSLYDVGARAMLEELTQLRARTRNEGPLRQLVVVGVGRLGRWVVAHAARLQRHQEIPLRITLVDRQASDRRAALVTRHPGLADRVILEAWDLDIDSPAFEPGPFVDAGGGPGGVAACVCLGDEALALTAGLVLARRYDRLRAPVLVRAAQQGGFAAVLTSDPHTTLVPFDLLERACRLEVLLLGVRETLARALHAEYLMTQQRRGETERSNAAMVTWDRLSEELRESNRRQAAHIAAKLDAVDCALAASLDGGDSTLAFSDEEVDRLARMEHERWRAEREGEGWQFVQGEKDLARKRSPYLVDWAALPPEIQETNRTLVRNLPETLARVGFRVHRRGDASKGASS